MSRSLRYAAYGAILGFALSRIGFSDYRELHNMFVFADTRMLTVFVAAVAISFAGFMVLFRLAKSGAPPLRPIHRGSIIGGILFGGGWVLTGACPSIALVQLGEGQLPALVTLVGMGLGTWLYPRVHARFFRFDTGSCDT